VKYEDVCPGAARRCRSKAAGCCGLPTCWEHSRRGGTGQRRKLDRLLREVEELRKEVRRRK
jgi:hypothetical protein